MEKKNQDFSMQEVMRLAKSPAGQQLIALLKQKDSASLEQVVAQAKSGDYAGAGKNVSAMLSSPEAQALMKQLEGK